MKTLYLDIFSGISGDMFVGALLDLGVDFHKLEQELNKLGLDGYHLHFARARKSSIEGVKFDVHVGRDHTHSHAQGKEVAHSHSHSHHGHKHEHGHGHDEHHHVATGSHSQADEHEHKHGRNFSEIKNLIATSHLS